MKFNHNHNTQQHERITEQHDSEKTMVDRASYTSMEKRIIELQAAGERLETARRASYHFGKGEPLDHDYLDSSTNPALDISDIDDNVDTNMDSLRESNEARKAATKKRKAEARAQKVAEAKEIAEAAQQELSAEKIDSQASKNGDEPESV